MSWESLEVDQGVCWTGGLGVRCAGLMRKTQRLSSQANDSGCGPLSCTDRSTCPRIGRKSQVRQLEGRKGRKRWAMAGWQRIYDILGVGAASPQSAATMQVERWDATGCGLSRGGKRV